MKNWPATNEFLQKYGDSVVREQKTRLRRAGRFAPSKAGGPLEDSLEAEPFETRRRFGVNFFMIDYGNFVDKGVMGWKSGKTASGSSSPYKFKPKTGKGTGKRSLFIEALKKWAKKVGVPEGAVFAIRRNIWANGIETTNFFTIPLVRSEKRFQAGLEKAMDKDIEDSIQKQIKTR